MKNKAVLISAIAATLACICLAFGVKGFWEEHSAGSEYETLLNAYENSLISTNESIVTEIQVENEGIKTTSEALEAISTQTTKFTTREDLDFKALQERNPDIYAWIEVPGTKVDYPIVQHPTDNTYYLTHTIDHKEATAASIYTETYNSTDFEDHLTVIYGHNMKNGSMFRTLHNFENYDFFEENREIIIYLPEQTRHYEIFAAYTYDNRHLLHTYYCEEPDSFEKYLDEVFAIKDMGAYIDHDIEVTGEDYVITLSTCVNSGNSSQRYLVQAVLVSIDQ